MSTSNSSLALYIGLTVEDPYTHLKAFRMTYVGIKPNRVDEEQVKLKVLLFFFKRGNKDMTFLYSPKFHWNLK